MLARERRGRQAGSQRPACGARSRPGCVGGRDAASGAEDLADPISGARGAVGRPVPPGRRRPRAGRGRRARRGKARAGSPVRRRLSTDARGLQVDERRLGAEAQARWLRGGAHRDAGRSRGAKAAARRCAVRWRAATGLGAEPWTRTAQAPKPGALRHGWQGCGGSSGWRRRVSPAAGGLRRRRPRVKPGAPVRRGRAPDGPATCPRGARQAARRGEGRLAVLAGRETRAGRGQWAIRTGTSSSARIRRVTPPTISSARRECS